MDGTATATEQKLMVALMQFHRLGWHQQSIAGCKPSEIRVLFCIKKSTGLHTAVMKVSEISKRMHVTSPTVTQLLNGLEAHGLIERQIDPIDRRAVGVKLTKKGEWVTQQAMEAFSATMHGLIEYLGEEQSDQLAELLSKAFRYFQEREASMYASPWNGDNEASSTSSPSGDGLV